MRYLFLMTALLAAAVTLATTAQEPEWEDNSGPIQAGEYIVDCSPSCCRKDFCADKLNVEIINNWDHPIKSATLRVRVIDYDRQKSIYDERHTVSVRVSPNESRPSGIFKLKRQVIAESMVLEIEVVSAK